MCFKKPTMPTVQVDPELEQQKAEARQSAQDQRLTDKQSRADAAIARASGSFGRGSLFSGGSGGAGFAAPAARTLFEAG